MADRFRILEKERERKKRMIRFLFFLSGNDLFDFGRNVVGSNVWFPNSYFLGCGRDVHAAACIFEQKPAKNSSRVFYRTILSVSSDSRVSMEHGERNLRQKIKKLLLKF